MISNIRTIANSILSGVVAFGLMACATISPANAETLALVVQKAAEDGPKASDAMVAQRLQSLGYTVRILDHTDPVSAASGVDAVVISSSVSANKLEGTYKDFPKPVILWESYLLPHMAMAGLKEEGDYGTKEHTRYAWMVNAPHPLSAGLDSGMVNIYAKNGAMNWGTPGLGATIISTVPGEPTKVLEFSYEKGATMDYKNIAPGRRVFLFLDATFPNLNDSGLKLFDAAIRWSVETPQ
jgi:hypothetical protein